jgi:D-hexose-6-phosphate mutarotase
LGGFLLCWPWYGGNNSDNFAAKTQVLAEGFSWTMAIGNFYF